MPLTISHIELTVLNVCSGLRLRTPVVGLLAGDAVLPHHFMLLEVDMYHRMAVADRYDGQVRVGEGGVHQVTHIAYAVVAISPFVDVVEGEE